jgi:hypothetical protein
MNGQMQKQTRSGESGNSQNKKNLDLVFIQAKTNRREIEK